MITLITIIIVIIIIITTIITMCKYKNSEHVHNDDSTSSNNIMNQ